MPRRVQLKGGELPESGRPCETCGALVVGRALEYAERVGIYRCQGTHCRVVDARLFSALRTLGRSPAETRVERLEAELRRHGLEVPP